MAHFAELDQNNVVLRVIVVNDDYLKDENGKEVEQLGKNHLESIYCSKWIQTSYNNNFRVRFAGIGFIYDETLDAFLPPKPYQSWILNQDSFTWKTPIEMPKNEPEGFHYEWDESSINWILVEN